MAEILLSLTIIGVVAAITLPSLTGNINERTWNTQRKALYSRMSQAVALMPALNNYGSSADNATETFITSGLAKVLKINNICSDNLQDCGIVSNLTKLGGSKIPVPDTLYGLNNRFDLSYTAGAGQIYSIKVTDTKAAAFETANGESVIAYYNPECKSADYKVPIGNSNSQAHYAQASMCVNFIYDLNGKKGPNSVGKDIGFITVFEPSDSSVVMVVPYGFSGSRGRASQASTMCREKFGDESRAPNKWEGAALFVNRNFVFDTSVAWLEDMWTTTSCDMQKYTRIHLELGYIGCLAEEGDGQKYYCIRRPN